MFKYLLTFLLCFGLYAQNFTDDKYPYSAIDETSSYELRFNKLTVDTANASYWEDGVIVVDFIAPSFRVQKVEDDDVMIPHTWDSTVVVVPNDSALYVNGTDSVQYEYDVFLDNESYYEIMCRVVPLSGVPSAWGDISQPFYIKKIGPVEKVKFKIIVK